MSENAEKEDLDSFFAKKDKGKKKSNKTRITPDDIVQLLEKKIQKAARKAKKDNQPEDTDNKKIHHPSLYEEHEWKVVDEEKEEKELSELKIQNLNLITKVDVDNAGGDEGVEENNDLLLDSQSGPWKPVSVAVDEKETHPEAHIEAQPAPKPLAEKIEVDKEETKPKKYIPPGARGLSTVTEPETQRPQKYVPPGARNQATVTEPETQRPQKYVPPGARNQGTRVQPGSRRKKVLDVSSVDDFPSLGK